MNTVNRYDVAEFLERQQGQACDNLIVLLTETASGHHETNRAKLVSFDGKVFHYRNVRFYSNQVESVLCLGSEAEEVQESPQQQLDLNDTQAPVGAQKQASKQVGENPALNTREENHEDEQNEQHEEAAEGKKDEGSAGQPAAAEPKPAVKTEPKDMNNAFRKGGKRG